MATFTQIKEVRLLINDPAGYQDLLETAALPAAPAPYTGYKLTTTGAYKATDLESGATDSDYETLPIRVSDARLSSWIDNYGSDIAVCKAYQAILASIGEQMRIKRLEGGAESTEYTDLKDLYNYYRDLWNDCKETNKETNKTSTGRYSKSKAPLIAGGNI